MQLCVGAFVGAGGLAFASWDGFRFSSRGRSTTQQALPSKTALSFVTPLTVTLGLLTNLRACAVMRSPDMELPAERAVVFSGDLSLGSRFANQPFLFKLIANLHCLAQRKIQFLSDLVIKE